MTSSCIEKWHAFTDTKDPAILRDLLASDVVFHSPVVHTPQRGKDVTFLYLISAMKVLGNDQFKYVREVESGDSAVLEFETELDGIHVNGIDMIRWNDAGEIIDFKVMVRPLKAMNILHAKMGEMLEQFKAQAK
ncbi:MAG: hypothetical protein CMK07_12825 [Ponticaulis sp.]|nr:hypothetical protein [Ponticaulis sp.]